MAEAQGEPLPTTPSQGISDLKELLQNESPGLEDKIEQVRTEIAAQRKTIVSEVKGNYILEHELVELDEKIKLLIRNRISLQEVVAHSQGLSSGGGKKVSSEDTSRLSVQNRKHYEHLFYLMQTDPNYLAKIARLATSSEIDPLLQTIVFTIYGDQYDSHQETLLMKLFHIILQEEFKECSRIGEFMRANSATTKILVAYTRRGAGAIALKETLLDCIKDVIGRADLNLELNPLKVYTQMINDWETQTGKTSPLPKNATSEEAAQNEEVIKIIQPRVQELKEIGEMLLKKIVDSVKLMPFGIRWICRQLRTMAKEKFPELEPHQVDSLVGGFVFLRFFNPAIVSPEASNLIKDKPTPTMRKNLIMVAKLMQNLSNGILFGGKDVSADMTTVNTFLTESRSVLSDYFDSLTNVDEDSLRDMEYLSHVKKGDAYIEITLNEMYLIHSLLSRHLNTVVSEADDPIHLIIRDLGVVPEKLPRADNETLHLRLENPAGAKKGSELSIEEARDSYFDLKQKLIMLFRAHTELLKGDSLLDVLQAGKRESISMEDFLMADQIKKLMTTVVDLVAKGYITSDENGDPTQALVSDLCKDLSERKRIMEALEHRKDTLGSVVESIAAHRDFLQSKVVAYKEYLQAVKSSTYSKGGGAPTKKGKGGGTGAGPVKLSHSALEDMQIVVESKVQPNVRKNVSFTFSCPAPGIFDVQAVFKGITVLKIQFELEDLLERQSNSQHEIDLEEVKLNVNMLIHFLNKKFMIQDDKK